MSNEAENMNGAQGQTTAGPTPGGTNASNKIAAVVQRAKAVLLDPAGTWQIIKAEPTSIKDIYQNYLVILAAVPAIATFIGLTVVGIQIPFFGTWRAPFFSTLVSQLLSYAISLGMVYVAAVVIEKLAPKFEAQADTTAAFKLVAYSITPAWVAGIFGVLPWLMVLAGLIGFGYSIYVFLVGVQPMTSVPEGRKIGYVAVSALVIFLLSLLLGFVAQAFSPVPGPAPFGDERLMPSQEMRELEESMKALQKAVAPLAK